MGFRICEVPRSAAFPPFRISAARFPEGIISLDGPRQPDDRGNPGDPYHVVLRAFMDCENLSDAPAVAQQGVRSSSANYLIAHEDGVAVDIEATPGDYSRLFLTFAEDGVLLHTNHFSSLAFDRRDVSLWVMPDSPFRPERLRARVASARVAGNGLSLDEFRAALGDHANYPSAICCHPDGRMDPHNQAATVASVLMDLDELRIWLADGRPCTAPYRELDVATLSTSQAP